MIGPGAETAVPALIEALKRPDRGRDSAIIALEKIGPASIPALSRALKDKDEEIRFYAAFTLGIFGPNAKPAVPILIEILKDQKENVRRAAALTLVQIDPQAAQAAVPVLTESLQHPNENIRRGAAEALKKVQQPSKKE
jgi:HEAT repeat protein